MELNVRELNDGVAVIALSGRLDTVWAREQESRFNAIAETKRAVVVDLTGVSFLGSLGMKMFVQGAKSVMRRGGRFLLLSPDPKITQVLKVAAIDSLIPILNDRAAALAAAQL